MVPPLMKGHSFQPFFEKRLPWGADLENGSLSSGGTIFFLNMIMKEKTAKGSRFPKLVPQGSRSSYLFFLSEAFSRERKWCFIYENLQGVQKDIDSCSIKLN